MRHVASRTGGAVAAANTENGVEGGEDGVPVTESEEERLEHLYEKIAWPLGRKYGHPYDAFKLALAYVYASIYQDMQLIFLQGNPIKFSATWMCHKLRNSSFKRPLRGD